MPATLAKHNVSGSTNKPGNTRVTGKEQYYTPAALAKQLLETVANLIPDLSQRTLLEPAGGTGAFVQAANEFGIKRIISFDIEPKAAKVTKQNFLETELDLTRAITISNPPFGRNNSLSIPFFNHAADYSDYIAFIVPRSWRKWSVMNRLDNRFHLLHDQDLNIDYVDDQGNQLAGNSRLATCFQVWERRKKLRPIVTVTDHLFIQKVSPKEADVALTIFGYGCGKVKTEFVREKNTTQMFLKLNHPRALEALKAVDFSRFFRNTAYTEALSLQEINFLLNEYLLGHGGLEENTK